MIGSCTTRGVYRELLGRRRLSVIALAGLPALGSDLTGEFMWAPSGTAVALAPNVGSGLVVAA